MNYKQSSIKNLIQKEKEIVKKYREFGSVISNEEEIILCEELTSKHNLHISVLEKYLER